MPNHFRPMAPPAARHAWLMEPWGLPLLAALLMPVATTLATYRETAGRTVVFKRTNYQHALRIDIESFRQEHERLPKSLAEVAAQCPDPANMLLSKPDFTNRWGHPYLYTTDGDRWTVTCLGRDGLPGGTGFDADFDYPGDTYALRPEDVPTLRQLVTDPRFRLLLLGPWVAAAGYWLIILVAKPAAGRARTPWAVALLTVVAVFAGMALAALHVPSHH